MHTQPTVQGACKGVGDPPECAANPVLACRLSEQRVHDLLDGLCTAVSKGNQLYTVSLNGKASVTWGDSIKSGENETWTTPSAGENEGRAAIHWCKLHYSQTARGRRLSST